MLFRSMSICLIRVCCAGFVAKNMAAWLSAHIVVGCVGDRPISCEKLLSHAACFAVSASSMYSASATDNATVFCHLERQLIAPLARVNTCPDVE